jgi:hypothetical protein
VLEDFLAKVVHGLLTDRLHDANLNVLQRKARQNGAEIGQCDQRQTNDRRVPRDFAAHSGNHVAIHAAPEQVRSEDIHAGDSQAHRHRQKHLPAIRPKILRQPVGEARVVELS